jgi:hypothetical protein
MRACRYLLPAADPIGWWPITIFQRAGDDASVSSSHSQAGTPVSTVHQNEEADPVYILTFRGTF